MPNHISAGKRIVAIIVIIISLLVLIDFVWTGTTTISAGKSGPSLKVSGAWALPAVAMFGGGLSAALALIFDHYDKRPNERFYQIWINTSLAAMLVGKLSAVIVVSHLKSKATEAEPAPAALIHDPTPLTSSAQQAAPPSR